MIGILLKDSFCLVRVPVLFFLPLPSQLPINGGGRPILGEPLPILMEEPPRVPLPVTPLPVNFLTASIASGIPIEA